MRLPSLIRRDGFSLKKANLGMKNLNEFQIDEALPAVGATDTSNRAFLSLLKRYKATNEPSEMQDLSERIERMIFHKQHENAKG